MFPYGVGIREPLFFIGVIENRDDPQRQGRVQVRAFGVHGLNDKVPTQALPWATCLVNDLFNQIPDENDFVFGLFIDGRDAQQPIIIGTVPTQYNEAINPETKGWGVITEQPELNSRATQPENLGQPHLSRLERGEELQKTHLHGQKMARVTKVTVADDPEGGQSWDEPDPGYQAAYPYNRVIQSARHIVELDDTPGSERITITNTETQSYVQIGSGGNIVTKATGARFDVTDENQYVHIGGRSYVSIDGDATVYVDGNKTEEITGDLKTIVHGNHSHSVGGQSNYNVSEQIQMRAGDIRMEANAGTLSIRAEKEMQIEAGIGMYRKAPFMWDQATSNMNIKANNLNMTAITDMNIKANQGVLNIFGESDVSVLSGTNLQVESGGNISVTASSTVYINDYVSMAEGGNAAATEAVFAEDAIGAVTPEMPEPPTKSTSVKAAAANQYGVRNTASVFQSDDGETA